jgi:hypothetical protein
MLTSHRRRIVFYAGCVLWSSLEARMGLFKFALAGGEFSLIAEPPK